MTLHYSENTAPHIATSWALKPLTEAELAAPKLVAIVPDVEVPAEGYFTLQQVVRSGVNVSIPLSKGITKNDTLMFALSMDGTLLYPVIRPIDLNDYNAPIKLFIPGEAFVQTGKRTVHFAYNIQRGGDVIMLSPSVDVPVRA